jgi:hypothetical protein
MYKGIPIKPVAYYNRPDNYREVPTLEILRECIKQDKYNPDIKHLECPGKPEGNFVMHHRV